MFRAEDITVLDSKFGLCTCCMEEHEIKTVKIKEKLTYKEVPVKYDAVYFYCCEDDAYYENGAMLNTNIEALRKAYKEQTRELSGTTEVSQGDER